MLGKKNFPRKMPSRLHCLQHHFCCLKNSIPIVRNREEISRETWRESRGAVFDLRVCKVAAEINFSFKKEMRRSSSHFFLTLKLHESTGI